MWYYTLASWRECQRLKHKRIHRQLGWTELISELGLGNDHLYRSTLWNGPVCQHCLGASLYVRLVMWTGWTIVVLYSIPCSWVLIVGFSKEPSGLPDSHTRENIIAMDAVPEKFWLTHATAAVSRLWHKRSTKSIRHEQIICQIT